MECSCSSVIWRSPGEWWYDSIKCDPAPRPHSLAPPTASPPPSPGNSEASGENELAVEAGGLAVAGLGGGFFLAIPILRAPALSTLYLGLATSGSFFILTTASFSLLGTLVTLTLGSQGAAGEEEGTVEEEGDAFFFTWAVAISMG